MGIISFLIGVIVGILIIVILGFISAWKQTKPQRDLYKEIMRNNKR